MMISTDQYVCQQIVKCKHVGDNSMPSWKKLADILWDQLKPVETTKPSQPRYSCVESLSFQPAGSLAQPMLATALAQRHGPGAAQAFPSCRACCLGPLHRNGRRYLQIHPREEQYQDFYPPFHNIEKMLQE